MNNSTFQVQKFRAFPTLPVGFSSPGMIEDLETVISVCRDSAKGFKDILGVIITGSYIKQRSPKLCRFSHEKFERAMGDLTQTYACLMSTETFELKKAMDIDIWVLVRGSKHCPSLATINQNHLQFLMELTHHKGLTAHDVGTLKRQYFQPFYKEKGFYTGLLSKEEEPWNCGLYASVFIELFNQRCPHLPFPEIRGFPPPVFHIRPHILTDENYSDREPMAFDLADWLTPDYSFLVVYQTGEADIWPFVEKRPQGSFFKLS